MKRAHWSVAMLVIAGVAMTGCSSKTASKGVSTSSSTTANSKETGPVVLVTYADYAIDETVKSQVEASIGAKIEVRMNGDAGAALSKAIVTAGKPEGDVFFGVDNTSMTRAIDARLFDGYTPNLLAQVPPAMDLDKSHRMVPIDSGSVCVDYDKKWFADKGLAPPTSFDDLADPKYKKLLAIENPVTSSPGLVFLMATHAKYGTGAADYWRKLKANGVAVVGSWGDAWNTRYTVHKGDRPLVISYASSPPAEVVYDNLKEPQSGVIENTCARQVEMAGVLRGAAHPVLARKLIDAMLTPLWQGSLPTSNFVDPIRTDVAIPDVYKQFAAHLSAPISIDPAAAGANRDKWIDEWRSIVE